MYKKILTFVLFLLISVFSNASDIIEIVPITNKIIALHFDDGYAVYHKKGEARSNERVVVELLDITKATNILNYSVSSKTDPNYSTAKHPADVGRKTKGVEFTWMCQSWNNGCVNTNPDHVKEHWIYLHLSEALQNNTEYWINTGDIANNGSEWKFSYNEKNNFSPTIHTNLIGHKPSFKKYAYLYHWMGDKGGLDLSDYRNKKFYIVNHFTDETLFEGTVKFRKSKTNKETYQPNETPNDNFLGSEVYECNFTDFKQPGKYRLVVENLGCSNPFKIDNSVYKQVFYTTIRGLYHNRSGIELKEPYTEFTRPAPHNPLITPGFSGKLKYTSSRFIDWTNGDHSSADKPAIEAGIKGSIDTWGWYQDAGDWDGYISHMKIPIILMFSWKLKPENYIDKQLNLPESGNGIPDILDEAAWLIRYYQRTRQLIMENGYGTGGVGGRVCGDHFGGDGEGIPSYEDVDRTYIVSGEDPHTTYQYAGLAAQFAHCLKLEGESDPEGIDWEREAREAFSWAKNNTLPGDEDIKPAMKEELKYFRSFAATSLYQLTGDEKYKTQLEIDLNGLEATDVLSDQKLWAPFVLANLHDSLEVNSYLKDKARRAVINTGIFIESSTSKRACRWGGNIYFPMVVGQTTTPMVFELILAHHFLKENREDPYANSFLTAIQTTADYFLGTNPNNSTWITGLGIKRPERVFHMDSWYNGKEDMAPGITPYGVHRDQSWFSGQGIWDVAWAYKSIYPNGIDNWPGHERWFGNYGTPLNAEFTVHQNTILNAAVYGFLCGVANPDFSDNKKPEFSNFKVLATNSDSLRLEASVADPDGNNTIHKVEFYNDWHKIGESKKAPFHIKALLKPGETIKIKAKVIDELGAYSKSGVIYENDIITSTKSIKKDNSVQVYPNPFKNEVKFYFNSINSGNLQLEVFNTNGSIVFSANTELNGSKKLTWIPNKQHLSVGIYYYRVFNPFDNQTCIETGKIIYQ